jgi:hypothetical protein
MVLTIVPPAVRGHSARHLVFNHVAGLVLGAVIMAAGSILVGAMLSSIAADAPAAGQLAAGVLAALWLPSVMWPRARRGLPWPRSRWQVPEQWRYTMPIGVTVFLFGALLGVGLLTATVLPVYWIFLLLATTSNHAVALLLAWFVYAATRGVMTAWRTRTTLADRVIPDAVFGPGGFLVGQVLAAGVIALVIVQGVGRFPG